MDVVTDLTSQCVSFITVAQEFYRQQLLIDKNGKLDSLKLTAELKELEVDCSKCTEELKDRIYELVVKSYKVDPKMRKNTITYFFRKCSEIFNWLERTKEAPDLHAEIFLSSAYEWRGIVRGILYQKRDERAKLAKILRYIPIQIIYCLGGKKLAPKKQRLLQTFELNEVDQMSIEDENFIIDWWKQKFKSFDIRSVEALKLLSDDAKILKRLLSRGNPIPYENLFIDELKEIANSRKNRRKVIGPANHWKNIDDHVDENDPYVRARKMNLYGLTFSGGGIRSATFNLGILQKLAEIGLLSRFDYLSTVSGGGYIGSWFAAWVKRSGSLARVSDRLNPNKSADPLADEVRPIRWLRMFSNYLAPNARLMSIDSWTAGITWLRNTLINQVILFMLLCAALSVANGLFNAWLSIVNQCDWISNRLALLISTVLLLAGAFLVGVGMQAFNRNRPPKKLDWDKKPYFYLSITLWAVLSALFASMWLVNQAFFPVPFDTKLRYLVGPAIACSVAFLAIAYIGSYHKSDLPGVKSWKINAYILGSSLIGACSGAALLLALWTLFERINCMSFPIELFGQKLAFVVGIPLVFETISVSVVIRMTIMGVLFPDLRREWWGRIGAVLHRLMLLWIIGTFAALMLWDYFQLLPARHLNLISLFGGWSAIIGYAIKKAYNSRTPNQTSSKTSVSYMEWFIRFAPYLFAVGFVLFSSIVLHHFYFWCDQFYPKNYFNSPFLTGIAIGAVTLFLSYRTGVNEFSLHHFYRNRLTRAYLGATRRREMREKTVNSFTGFDQEDDLLLTELTTRKGYYGPYPIINTTLNATAVTDLDRQDRKGESFIFTPKYCGFDVSRTRPSSNSGTNVYDYGYRPTRKFAYPRGPGIGTAMTISGAAISPNMGYHSSPATAFLLTLFNLRLGWWIGNPRTDKWTSADPRLGIIYLLKDLMGNSDITSGYVCLSDGGHFDNMGLYELVRRHCTNIVVCDAEEDENTVCEGLANAIRRCRIDFGVRIVIELNPITRKKKENQFCAQHIVQGTVWYPRDVEPSGTLTYIKTSLTGKESVDIREYFLSNPTFPQQSTANQFFDEAQFESYRKLGYESISSALSEQKL